MSSSAVSILIATRDRHADLTGTLSCLQGCRPVIQELVVIDDGSVERVEFSVHRQWADAAVIRHEKSAGQCQRRSEGFTACRGRYILQLDDDSAPVNPEMLNRAVQVLANRPEIGLVAFHVFNGKDLPGGIQGHGPSRYTASFVGCGALIRRDAVLQIGGYTAFFGNEWEEEELSLRLMKTGWGLWYDPSLIIHHRVSPRNRRSDRTWMRGFRNKLWSLVMHFPLHRVLTDGAWVLAVACWDAFRMLRFRWLAIGLWQFAAGLPRVLALRAPMSATVMARYDALRFRLISTREEFDSPSGVSVADIWQWFTTQWWNRARQRSFWDRRAGDTGTSPTVGFAHEKNSR
jgi:glycosyltransferase involved in cell wall biosynthesis